MKNQGNVLLPDNLHLRAQILQCTCDVCYLYYNLHCLELF